MMADPAIEAAQRAAHIVSHDGRGNEINPWQGRVFAAREALKPIRELHQPEWDNCINACCSGKECKNRTRICGHCWGEWPCDTAKLIYTTEELA